MSKLKDMKEALTSGIKPDISHCRYVPMVYRARTGEYGSDKYARANYLRQPDSDRECFERYRQYLRAMVAHGAKALDALERHQAGDPELQDSAGMRAAMFAADTEGTARYRASGLPHIAHALMSGDMGVALASDYGMLPNDPGQPWRGDLVESEVSESVARKLHYGVGPVENHFDLSDISDGVPAPIDVETTEPNNNCDQHRDEIPRSWCGSCP